MLNQTNIRFGIPETFSSEPASSELYPSAGIPFIQIDQGQAGPRFVRPTVVCAPADQNLQKQGAPFGIMVQPLAEMQTEYNSPEANYGEIPSVDLRGDG